MSGEFKTFTEQAKLLIQRGMGSSEGLSELELQSVIEERLHYINYYRFSAYWYPFRQLGQGKERLDDFKAGTYWEKIEAYYMFDRRLRNLIFDAIARIEISLRTLVAYCWAQASGVNTPQGDSRQYVSGFVKQPKGSNKTVCEMDRFLGKVNAYYLSSLTECAKHYRDEKKVGDARLLPIWVFVEFTTLGNLSVLLSHGLEEALVDKLADEFGWLCPPEAVIFRDFLVAIQAQ